MQGNGEHHANDERLPATARAAGFASPFDRPEWFDLLGAHGFAGRGRIDAHRGAGSPMAWLPPRTEKPGGFAGLHDWYSFSRHHLFNTEPQPIAAWTRTFASLTTTTTSTTSKLTYTH